VPFGQREIEGVSVMRHLLKRGADAAPVNSVVREPSLRFNAARAVDIPSHEDLLAMQPAFVKALAAELRVREISSRLCPVLLADHSVAIFSLAEHVGSDQADALAGHIRAEGYRLAEPQRYVLAAPLLLAVARNQLGETDKARAASSLSPTALAQAFQDMVEWGVRHGASDLHINIRSTDADSEVRYTLSGRYVAPERFRRIPTTMLFDMLSVAWMDIRGGNGAVFDPLAEQQGSLLRQVDGKPVLLRWASLSTDHGPSVCIRLLERTANSQHLTLEQLGYLPEQIGAIEQAMRTPGGAVIFAGAVGSGKSTTLASLVSRIPEDRKVITLEDPVEYLIPRALQNTVVRGTGFEAADGFSVKLRALKRSAMNDVLLGEIRDRETGAAFMDLAGAGVSVYTTTHALSARLIPERLASDFIGVSRDFLCIPGVLKLLVYQALLPVLCPHCAQEGIHRNGVGGSEIRRRNPKGCSQCRAGADSALWGYAGRTVVAECIAPAAVPGFLESLRIPGRAVAADGQTALDCAVGKALVGHVDLSDVEACFGPFDPVQTRPWGSSQPGLRMVSA